MGSAGKFVEFYEVLSMKECCSEILQLTEAKNFYVKDITKKVCENIDQLGFGFFDASKRKFLGFILLKYEIHDAATKTIRLHLEYLLVADSSKGLGSRMVAYAMEQAENEYSDYCITIFAEAKPSDIAIHLWLNKLEFNIQTPNFIEGVYYPLTKVYHEHKRIGPAHREGCLECSDENMVCSDGGTNTKENFNPLTEVPQVTNFSADSKTSILSNRDDEYD